MRVSSSCPELRSFTCQAFCSESPLRSGRDGRLLRNHCLPASPSISHDANNRGLVVTEVVTTVDTDTLIKGFLRIDCGRHFSKALRTYTGLRAVLADEAKGVSHFRVMQRDAKAESV
jgi:hypothetical protein